MTTAEWRAVHPDLAAILDETRLQIARGDEPDAPALEARIRAVPTRDAERALEQLNRLLAVHRARRSLHAAPPNPPAAAVRPARRTGYKAKPTIAANMTVRAKATGETVTLEWQAVPGVVAWEARLSERPDARSDYVERETRHLEGTSLELSLTDSPKRIHLLGRNSYGRLLQRAVISGLTAENWDQRWQQRASAS
jgi:hypothetical protein